MFPGPAREVRPRATRPVRVLVLAVLASALSLALANSAMASTASVPNAFAVSYSAAAGETNDVTVTVSAGTSSGSKVVYQDTGATITAGTGCTVNMAGDTATCDNLSVPNVLVNLGDGDDSDTPVGDFKTLGLRLQLFGGSGQDTLVGGNGDDFFMGDAANGAGDANDNQPNDDSIDGGTGFNTVSYFLALTGVVATVNDVGGTVDAMGAALETDTYSNIEEIDGSQHADDLTTDGVSFNVLKGQGDDDTLNSDDGVADRIDCDFSDFAQSPGAADAANVDAVDTVVSGSDDPDNRCETVNRSSKGAVSGGGGAPAPATTTTTPPANTPPPPPPSPPAPPTFVSSTSRVVVASGPGTGASTASTSGLLTVPGIVETCGTGPCSVVENVYQLAGRTGAASAGRFRLGHDRDTLASGQSNPARLRLTKRAERKLRKRRKLRVQAVVTLTDAQGHVQVVRKKFTLRAPKKH